MSNQELAAKCSAIWAKEIACQQAFIDSGVGGPWEVQRAQKVIANLSDATEYFVDFPWSTNYAKDYP